MEHKKTQSSKLRRSDLGSLHEKLSQRIKGQPGVISRLVESLLIRETEAVPQQGARGAFFFAGPTGSGKTVLAKSVAELLFGPGHLAVFDGAEFKSIESMEGLLGSRKGDPGRFAETYEKVPAGVWLFDELEKSERQFVDLFLAMIGEGRVTTANGRPIDLCGLYIIATSNLGSAEIIGRPNLPFESLERHVVKRVEQHLRPEGLARFGDPYVFRPLSRSAQAEIASQNLGALLEWEKTMGRNIQPDPSVIPFLIQRGFSDRLGARPLLKTINKYVGSAIADKLVKGLPANGRLVVWENRLKLQP